MKKRALQVAVVAMLVVAAFVLRGRPPATETPESSETTEATESYDVAKAAVFDFFDAAERGDDRAYLQLTGGELRTSLENSRQEMGLEAFRSSLRRSAAGITGVAITRGGDAPPGLMALEVELVFVDRNERQRMLLAPKGKGWIITAIDAAEMVKPSIPYGTPVFEDPGQETPEAQQPVSPRSGVGP